MKYSVTPDLRTYKAVLFDLDGTLCHQDTPLAGARELLAALDRMGMPYGLISNSTNTRAFVSARLGRMGMEVDANRIFTAGDEAVEMVLSRFGERPRVFHLSSLGIHAALDGKVTWVEKPGEGCDVVLIGDLPEPYCSLDRLRIALELLRAGAYPICLCADRLFTSSRGIEIGCGAIGKMFSYALGREVEFCGKPQGHFFRNALTRLGVDPGGAVLIGDNLESDIAGGRGVGMETVLILTGVVREEELVNLEEDQRPDFVIPDLGCLSRLFE